MKMGEDGLPVIGASGRTLGARTGDIPIDGNGMVHPGTGGMSVSPYDPMNLPSTRRPPELGGVGKDPVWGIQSNNLGSELSFRIDPNKPSTHGFIEPGYSMDFIRYQQALANTQPYWNYVNPK